MSEFKDAVQLAQILHTALAQVIKGRDDTIKLVLTALFADGHILLEDYPGSGKTLLTKTLGKLIKKNAGNEHILPFRRIQFTPDMLPSDILGVNVFDAKTASFHFMYGPIFAHILLADEINRAGPKVQAAFLECMAEKQVTIDNTTYKLEDPFFVIGTQNPLEMAGTYPLPLVQLDRFLLKIPMNYVNKDVERNILKNHLEILKTAETIEPICDTSDIIEARKHVNQVHINEKLIDTMVDIANLTRTNPVIALGVSTRGIIMLQQAMRSFAFLSGRDYATEDDLKTLLPYVLLHRMKFRSVALDAKEEFFAIINPVLEKLISS